MEAMALIYTTWPDAETAQAAGRRAVEQRLAACANILGTMQAIYWWDGAVQAQDEVPMLLKTRASLADALRDMLIGVHPYDVPCVVVVSVQEAGSNAAFLGWIEEQTASCGKLSYGSTV
jgi:periplasmic divalent cation tolerance protein